MKKLFTTILILSAIALLSFGAYVYFSNSLSVDAADSSLSSSQGSPSPVNALASSDKISQDTAFLSTLTSLTKIKIDTSLFTDTSFNALNDNTVILEQSVPGRVNPFAPIEGQTPVSTDSPVVTNPPTQITTKSAVLDGTTNNVTGVTSVYFEYGPTPVLGKATPPTKQSLIGTFGANITGLTSGTTYFYRAAAKINGVVKYGDVISFNTN